MKRTPPEKLERLLELATEGLPDQVVAMRLGLGLRTVRQWRRKYAVVHEGGWRQVQADC